MENNNITSKNENTLDEKRYLTSNEAAVFLGITKNKLYKWIDKGYFEDVVKANRFYPFLLLSM